MLTLCNAIPAFEAMSNIWKQQKEKLSNMSDIIQEGLDKLEAYYELVDSVPAYVLAMSLYSDLSLLSLD